jgi:hypothetical protein
MKYIEIVDKILDAETGGLTLACLPRKIKKAVKKVLESEAGRSVYIPAAVYFGYECGGGGGYLSAHTAKQMGGRDFVEVLTYEPHWVAKWPQHYWEK